MTVRTKDEGDDANLRIHDQRDDEKSSDNKNHAWNSLVSVKPFKTLDAVPMYSYNLLNRQQRLVDSPYRPLANRHKTASGTWTKPGSCCARPPTRFDTRSFVLRIVALPRSWHN